MTQNNKINVSLYNNFVRYHKRSNIEKMSNKQFSRFVKNYLLKNCFYTVSEYLSAVSEYLSACDPSDQ
ncbi:unnamed protein product [Acanthoscelides obtectus]|uniref:Uncharacterized protein n=1 Tax=Acanthoscelides obtectus TaxID=200917 RepID=A0A9P0QD49_ACAOB|nr:unnamed protein product [Acanthoscelides obtectus]CAK1685543.1 hypothetical protein AOBTE_LOCUS35495 [Acanthoscelides obtectus]